MTLKLELVTPERLKLLSDQDLKLVHRLVHEDYDRAKSNNKTIEPAVNVHHWIEAEFIRRHIPHDTPMYGFSIGSKQAPDEGDEMISNMKKWKEWPIKVHDLSTPLKRIQARDDLRLLAAAWARLKDGKEIRSEGGKGPLITIKEVQESAANILESLVRADAVELHPEEWKGSSKGLMDAAIETVRQRGLEVPIEKSTNSDDWSAKTVEGIVVVPTYVAVVGSAAKEGIKQADDIDLCIRDEKESPHYWKENLYLVLRHIFDPDKTGKKLHLIFNPQGPHEGDFIPIFDLVLRRSDDNPNIIKSFKLVKSANQMPGWRNYIKNSPEGLKIDLGPAEDRALGFVGMGREGDIQIECDLEQIPWSLRDNSVSVFRANHILEHLTKSTQTMLEIYRCLKPDGIIIITVPSTEGQNAFAHPEHKSFWNKLSFSFWTDSNLAKTVDGQTDPPSIFDLEYLSDRQVGLAVYTDVVLRKPVQPPIELDAVLPKGQRSFEKSESMEKSYSRMKCMHCSKQPEIEVLWAEGMAHAWFCNKHFKEWKNSTMESFEDKPKYETDIDNMREIKWGVASEKWSDQVTKKESEEYIDSHKIAKRELKPITSFQAPHPAQRGRGQTDAYAVDELWDWAEPKINSKDDGVTVEPKFNGFRSIIQSDGNKISIRLEGGSEKFPIFVRADQELKKLQPLPSFILDVNIGISEGNKIWPRPKLMTLESNSPVLSSNAHIKITAFDLLYWDGISVNEKPFIERRTSLEKIKGALSKAGIDISDNKRVKTKQDIMSALKSTNFGSAPMMEGIVLKQDLWTYQPGPSTTGMVKIKHTLEVKAKVIEKKTLANGKKSYRGGLLPAKMLDTITNLKEYNDRLYVDMGFSFNSDMTANEGDTVTFSVDEIIYNEQKKHMAWLGAVALDIDKTRGPFAAGQVIDMAERAGVLQHTEKTTKQMTTSDIPTTIEISKPLQIWMPKRKLPDWMKSIFEKAESEGDKEGGTRGERASGYFAKNWFDLLPKSGKGRFVYQHHWPALKEDETKLSDEELMNQTEHAAHGDLRLEGDDALWGFSVFIGKMEDNRNLPNIDKLIDFTKLGEKKLQCTPKLPQPKEWLNVGVGKPHLADPGEAGVVGENNYAKIFALDHGTYELGACREHGFEIFLNGSKLKGKLTIGFAPISAEGRIWIINRPDNQTPHTEETSLKSELKDVKSKRQPYLIWADPEHKPVFIDVAKDSDTILAKLEEGADDWEALKIVKSTMGHRYAEILKAEGKKKFTYSVVYKASKSIINAETDAHNEFATADELQESLWDYVRSGDRRIYIQHGSVKNLGYKKAGEWVELATFPYDFKAEFKLPGQPVRKTTIPAGSIMMGVVWDDWSWPLVEKGVIRGFSFGGFARRTTV